MSFSNRNCLYPGQHGDFCRCRWAIGRAPGEVVIPDPIDTSEISGEVIAVFTLNRATGKVTIERPSVEPAE